MAIVEGADKAIARRINGKVWGERNLDVANEFVAEDYAERSNAMPEAVRGPEGNKENVREFREGCSDVGVTVEDLIAEDNRVVSRNRISDTHRRRKRASINM